MQKVTKAYSNTIMGRTRQRFGQPQQWWAYYLDVSLAQIKMAESADRSLPMAAFTKLGQLEVLYHTTIEKETANQLATKTVLPLLSAKLSRSKLAQQADKLNYQAFTTQNKLLKMQLQYQQALNCVAMANHLLAAFPTTEQDTTDKLSLEIARRKAEKQTVLCGPESQRFLQWKIDCYVYAAARAKELDVQKMPDGS